MHKITKGLKKKKKGKKSKHKEEELFKPEELEAYRREHQDSGAAPDKNEEWKKFLALTSGVDDVLKKTQGDLDRIKSTSFFQRVPPPSEVKKLEEAAQELEEPSVQQESVPSDADLGIVQVSESESEEEEDDDIFDTAYIDAIAAGEVKLAYIPESPTEETAGDDPFDTTIAERAILGPAVERKGKKLVPIGAAVEVLTGRVQIPTCATPRPASTRRQVLKEQNLLLGSFDDNANSIQTAQAHSPEQVQRTLLDDDAPIPLAEEPIDLSKSLYIPPVPTPISNDPPVQKPDEDDEEFAQLAAESLAKTPVTTVTSLPVTAPVTPVVEEENWAAFENEKPEESLENGIEEDPFDTTFAENILPGKAELKIIENEILKEDLDFDPRAEDKLSQIINKVSIKVTDPAGQRESISSLDRVSEEDLNLIKPIHRDLLGGSNTDLSNLSDQPLRPSEQIDENYIEYCDPFDTSIVESVKLPGQTELKFLEKELLGDVIEKDLSDEEFDPRAGEPKERTLSRPDVLNIAPKTVSFDLPSPEHLLDSGEEAKVIKPLTPFYVRKNSVPEQFILEEDPFDTSFVSDIGPGKVELKIIESELFDPETERNLSISDPDFDPRDDNKAKREQVVQSIKDIAQNKKKPVEEEKPVDLLAVEHQVSVKVLTPAAEKPDLEEISYTDPFDTSSIATNILPGKTELKLLETSNPFLMGDESNYPEDTGDNPFLSQPASNSNSTNPFAFDPMDLVPPEPENTFIDVSSTSNNQIFATTTTTTTSQDFFSINENQDLLSDVVEAAPQKPTELDLKYTNTVANGAAPTRPPPPRPPPSKETQDLLMSVMGAMDATSSHLLDRIPPTRTPSPVSMRDLHSPSPTPEPNLGDLLDVGSGNHKTSTEDLMSLNQDNSCDINQNTQEANKPLPVRPARPPRPKPPQNSPAPPPKPPPPAAAPIVPPVPAVPAQKVQDEMDLFGVEEAPSVPKVATKADILNLYNAPPKQEKTATDLLFDNMEPELQAPEPKVEVEEPVLEVKQITPELPVQEPVIQDTFISPEPSQNDLQMDTSDSQSKGSVSSVTFNPFAATEDANNQQDTTPVFQQDTTPVYQDTSLDNSVFLQDTVDNQITEPFPVINTAPAQDFTLGKTEEADEFDAFAQKFESVKDENKNGAFDAFSGSNNDAWGSEFGTNQDSSTGFGADESFDAFLALQEPPGVPQSTPNRVSKAASQESDEDKDFSVFIRPKGNEEFGGVLPTIAPPPAPVQAAFTDTSPRFNPFDQQNDVSAATVLQEPALPLGGPEMKRTDSQETPPTPLFDEDVSQPLEPFPRINYTGEGWEMHLRQPNKKKITGQRFWKKIFVKLVYQADCVLLQLFNQQSDKDPFQELPLQPCYSVSEIGAQQYDQFGKIFTIKLQYIFYKERPGVRPGQVKKAERITNKLSQFAAYAIQGDYQGVKEFGSDLKKLGLPVEHAPQVSQLMKLGSLNYEDLKQFSFCIEEALFRLQAHRDRALHYKMEEVQITLVDELYVEQDADGHVEKQIARVRLFFLGFLTGMPDIELGVNDMRRQGKEVVGRHDIIPVVTEEWIRLEEVEFHSCVQQDEYNDTHIIKFKPPDACYIELMRFRVRPPKNRELPLQLKATICVTGNRVELRADVLVPGFASRKLGQIPCEDVMIRFPIPECWIYLFRVEKHFRYGSVKSAHRRTGKIKGIERILGTMDTLQESLIEVTSGQAKYEHQHRAIVWRCPRLPKEGQGAYTTHNMVCKLALTSYDQMPDKLAEYCYVEFTMPATQVSHTTCRSVSMQNSDSDEPPEKYVRYLARHEYRVGIEHTQGEGPNAYAAATFVKTAPPPKVEEEKPAPVPEEESSSDSD